MSIFPIFFIESQFFTCILTNCYRSIFIETTKLNFSSEYSFAHSNDFTTHRSWVRLIPTRMIQCKTKAVIERQVNKVSIILHDLTVSVNSSISHHWIQGAHIPHTSIQDEEWSGTSDFLMFSYIYTHKSMPHY